MMYIKMMGAEDLPDHMSEKGFTLVEVPSGCYVKFKREMIQSPYADEISADGIKTSRVLRKYASEEERIAELNNTRPKVIIERPEGTPNIEYYPEGNTYLMNEKGDTVASFRHRAPEIKVMPNGMRMIM